MTKKSMGQYFTKNKLLQNKVFEFILNKPDIILEPSFGQGHLVKYITEHMNVKFDMFEIDDKIDILDNLDSNNIIYSDFLKYDIKNYYKTIIGNPPFIKTKTGNMYLDFIHKCYNLLCDNGELIFIIPSDFFKLTRSRHILNTMLENGSFTHIYNPNYESLFSNASIDILIFRYCKNKDLEHNILYNDELLYIKNNEGFIVFDKDKESYKKKVEDLFNIYVGIVNGKEQVFKNEDYGNIIMLDSSRKYSKYILIEKYPTSNEELNKYLHEHKEVLINRKIRKFNYNNWWEWGALRNIKIMEKKKDCECIYIHTMTRKSEIAFKGKVGYFGGSLIMLLPKTNIDLDKYINYFNSIDFRRNFTYNKRFKIAQRQLCKSYLNE